jgi:hypothetical protein
VGSQSNQAEPKGITMTTTPPGFAAERAAFERVANYVADIHHRLLTGQLSENAALERVANYVADEQAARLTTPPSIADIPARELIDEVVGRLGAAETCRRAGLPASTDLRQFANKLDELR